MISELDIMVEALKTGAEYNMNPLRIKDTDCKVLLQAHTQNMVINQG